MRPVVETLTVIRSDCESDIPNCYGRKRITVRQLVILKAHLKTIPHPFERILFLERCYYWDSHFCASHHHCCIITVANTAASRGLHTASTVVIGQDMQGS